MSNSAFGAAANKMVIDIWSDTMCPFCYIGDTVLEQVLNDFEHKDQVEIRYHSYQLMPELSDEPADLEKLLGERYSAKQRAAQNAHIEERGKELGLKFNFDKTVTVNTLTAHRVSHYASNAGKGHEFMRLLFKAYFTDGQNLADPNTLGDLANKAGLNKAAALEVANSSKYQTEVEADIAMAKQLGFGGVPAFIFDNKYGVSGAQTATVFKETLNRAWSER